MSWASVGSLGSVQEKVDDTSTVLTTTATAEVGNVILVAIAADNTSTTDGDNSEVSSVVDSSVNTYTKLKEQTNSEALAGAGAMVSLWYTTVTTQLTSGGTITANFAAGTRTAKAVSAWKFTVTAGATITLEGSTSAVGDLLDPAAMTIASLASQEYLWFAAHAAENPNSGSYTKDADYTAIDKNGTTGGGGATNMFVAGGFRIFTGTTDTYDASTDAARDHAQVYVALKEAAGGGDTSLVVADAVHDHTADNSALTQAHLLAVADTSHAHTVETPTLTQAFVLAAADAEHAHISENAALTQAHALVVADAAHDHTSENVVLQVAGGDVALVVADVVHDHAADSLALIQAHTLAVAGAEHAHAVETLALVQAFVLLVASAAHAHPVDTVVLIGGSPYQPAPAARRIRVAARDSVTSVPAAGARVIVVDDE